MSVINRKEAFILFVGDVVFLIASLWLTLALRYLDIPSATVWMDHLTPFSILFIFWLLIYYIAGIYEKHTLILRNSLPRILFNTQIINSVVAVVFFYFIPYFAITPKTNLFIYLIVSLTLISTWRILLFPLFSATHRDSAVLIGSGNEFQELQKEVNNNSLYNFKFVKVVDLDAIDTDFGSEIVKNVVEHQADILVVDIYNKKTEKIMPELYKLILSGVQVINNHELYESIFRRVPISQMNHNWFLENVSIQSHASYDMFKRICDFLVALILGIISLIFYPFVFLALKIDDGGPLFYFDERVGRGGMPFWLVKFRSMREKDGGEKSISALGRFLRRTRIDELPEFWNVLRGDMSLIGPRPERTDLSKIYNDQINFYNSRNIIKPGLSGWAQLHQRNHPHHDAAVDATLEKLSYDLYYVKNRSLWLDFKIGIRTLAVLMLHTGR